MTTLTPLSRLNCMSSPSNRHITPLHKVCPLFIVHRPSPFYTLLGKKKLKQVETEILRLTKVRHPNIVSVFAVKLHFPQSTSLPKLSVLYEKSPALTLHDVLEDCDSLKEDRVIVGSFALLIGGSLIGSSGLYWSDSVSFKCCSRQRTCPSRYFIEHPHDRFQFHMVAIRDHASLHRSCLSTTQRS